MRQVASANVAIMITKCAVGLTSAIGKSTFLAH
jgi:hypothetical protein